MCSGRGALRCPIGARFLALRAGSGGPPGLDPGARQPGGEPLAGETGVRNQRPNGGVWPQLLGYPVAVFSTADS
jgi:hypothetical protein